MKLSLLKRLTLAFVVYLGVLLGMSMLLLLMSTKVGGLTTELYQIDYQKKEIVVFTGLAFGTALFIGIIVLFIIYHSITRDIGAIKGGIKHMVDGDFSYKLLITSRDELGLLAQSFNTLVKHLKELDDRKKTEAFELFRTCIQAYHDNNLPLLALAAAKAARRSLGIDPGLQALLVRLYTAAGLLGNADKEFHSSLEYLGLDKIALFQGLNREEILAMLEVMEIQPIPKNRPVFRQGERGADIFIIHAGRFEVMRDNQRLRVMLPGGIFGEIGFFSRCARSSTVRALDQGTLIRLNALSLRPLCDRYPLILQVLETLYTERLIRKEGEDIQVVFDELSCTTEVSIPKGTEISPFDGITIVKHGIVEVKTDEPGPAKKNFMGPGKILNFSRGRATASTDVRLIKARCEFKELQPAKP